MYLNQGMGAGFAAFPGPRAQPAIIVLIVLIPIILVIVITLSTIVVVVVVVILIFIFNTSGGSRCAVVGVPWCLGRLVLSGTF